MYFLSPASSRPPPPGEKPKCHNHVKIGKKHRLYKTLHSGEVRFHLLSFRRLDPLPGCCFSIILCMVQVLCSLLCPCLPLCRHPTPCSITRPGRVPQACFVSSSLCSPCPTLAPGLCSRELTGGLFCELSAPSPFVTETAARVLPNEAWKPVRWSVQQVESPQFPAVRVIDSTVKWM